MLVTRPPNSSSGVRDKKAAMKVSFCEAYDKNPVYWLHQNTLLSLKYKYISFLIYYLYILIQALPDAVLLGLSDEEQIVYIAAAADTSTTGKIIIPKPLLKRYCILHTY